MEALKALHGDLEVIDIQLLQVVKKIPLSLEFYKSTEFDN